MEWSEQKGRYEGSEEGIKERGKSEGLKTKCKKHNYVTQYNMQPSIKFCTCVCTCTSHSVHVHSVTMHIVALFLGSPSSARICLWMMIQ